MGLFSDSKSSNVTNLTETVTTETTQTDQSGGSGLNFSDTGDVGLSFSSTENNTLNETHVETDQGAVDAGRELGLAAIDAAKRANADSLGILAGLATSSIDASKTVARDSAENSRSFLSDAIAGFGTLAKQSSATSDDRVVKLVGFALAAIAAVVVLPALLRGKATV